MKLNHCLIFRCPLVFETPFCKERKISKVTLQDSKSTDNYSTLCLNDCSGRGECVSATCHCPIGYWGADCSLNFKVLKNRGNWAKNLNLRLKIYVYELPPEFNTWQFLYSGGERVEEKWGENVGGNGGENGRNKVEPSREDRGKMGEAFLFLERLLISPYRTVDPNLADFFFVPLFLRFIIFFAGFPLILEADFYFFFLI